jgi:outer membrane protein OmpA-like peptidoglycan-associated protein
MKLKAALIAGVVIGVVMLLGRAAAWSQEYPKAEISIDYSYVHYGAIDFTSPHYEFARAFNLNGGGGSGVYNISPMFGIKAEFLGYDSDKQRVTLPPGNPYFPLGGTAAVSGNLFTFLFGPQIGKRYGIFRPYAQVLVGGAHTNAYSNSYNGFAFGATSKAPSGTAFALDAGLGVDIAVGQHFAIRPFEVSWLYTDFSNAFTNNQQSFRYLGGLVFSFGGKPPVPLATTCSVSPSEVLPWEGPVTATVQPSNNNPKHTLTYTWSSTSGTVTGDRTSAKIDTTSLTPATYTVAVSVADPKEKKMAPAACSATFTVKSPRAPVVTCSADRTSVQPGQSVTLTAQGSSPDQQRLKDRSFSASAGSIRESQTSASSTPGSFVSTATLDTTGVAPGTINLALKVTDVHDLAGSCEASVNVQAPPPPPQATVVGETLLSECEFKNDKKRARVDNECKATLDSIALKLQQDQDGKVVIVGYAEDEEAIPDQDLAAFRAYNSKQYLATGEGKQNIDASRVEVRESPTRGQGKKAKFYFVPSGGTFTQTDNSAVDEGQMPKNTLGIPGKK